MLLTATRSRRIFGRFGATSGFACAGLAHAHPLDAVAPAASWPGWSFEPWVVACLLVSATLYAVGMAQLWRRAGPSGRAAHARQSIAFVAAWLATVAALVSPLDRLGSSLFSAHMLQHEVLMVVAAPLFVLARPLGAWAWALPMSWRRGLGHFFHRPAWRLPWLIVTGSMAAWAIHAATLWLWHIPAWFEAALANEAVHALQHASFLVGALVYWWSVIAIGARRPRGAAMLSLFTTMVHTGALGALLTLSPVAWYPANAGTTHAFGLEPLEDQQLGGLVMWIPAGLAYVACGLASALQWLDREPPRRLANG